MINRRQFIRNCAVGGAGVILQDVRAAQNSKSEINLPAIMNGAKKSRVVTAQRDDIFDHDAINSKAVSALLDQLLQSLFTENSDFIWKSLFKPNDTVGIKVNCLAGRGMSTHPELVEAIIERLQQAGIPSNHIIVWDRHDRDLERAGFKLNQGGHKVQCYGSNRTGFTQELYEFGFAASLLSRILTDQCTAMINVPILKDHGIVGMSGALKNNFGMINNPNKYHDNLGDPYVADVAMLSPIRQKTRLIICDCLQPQYEGGPPYMPQWTWKMNSLMAAVDPVAHDQIGWQIIEEKRLEMGFPSLAEVGRESGYIATAAGPNYQVGTNDPEKIEWLHV